MSGLDVAHFGAPIALALVLSMLVAFVYTLIHKGTTLQHTFVQSLAVAGVVSAVVVLAVGDNVARGIGLVGALTVIRFRSTLKDSRDLIFAFASLSTGVAAGAQAYVVAVAGTLVFLGGVALAARMFKPEAGYDAILTLRTRNDVDGMETLNRVLGQYTTEYTLVRVRGLGGSEQEHSYQVTLRHQQAQAALMRDVEAVAGATNALLVAYAPALEA
jgi:uncharacterized membrane protein YhiD involved in acid resistance